MGGILKTLLEKGLVKIMGRKNLPGRPLVYGTTRKFLEVFDLKDIESLPKIKELKALGSEDDEQQSLFEQKQSQRGSPSPRKDLPLSQRINRILSLAGITSRRKADEWIQAGRVAVNGEVVRERRHSRPSGESTT